jgi:hypothetical protein
MQVGIVSNNRTEEISLADVKRAIFASRMRTAFASIVREAGSSSLGEVELTRSTSEVGACC